MSRSARSPASASTEELRRYALDELFDSLLYRELAKRERDPGNRAVLEELSREVFEHYLFWFSLSGPVSLSSLDRLRPRA